jgi:hypothetical protein
MMHRYGCDTGETCRKSLFSTGFRRSIRVLPYAAAAVLTVLALSVSGCSLSAPPSAVGGYALVYGISDYEGEGNDLVLPVTDAENIAALLERQGYTVTLRRDSEVDKSTVAADLEEAARRLTAADTFVFYYAGHGVPVFTFGPEPFPVDKIQVSDNQAGAQHSPMDEALVLYGSIDGYLAGEYDLMLLDDELAGYLGEIPAGRKVVILDACNTGGFIGSSPVYDALPPNYSVRSTPEGGLFSSALRQYAEFGSRAVADIASSDTIVIAAAGEREESYEEIGLGGGVFTVFFLESVRYGDRNRDGWVSLLESYRYAFDSIERRWNAVKPNGAAFAPRISSVPVDFILFAAESE